MRNTATSGLELREDCLYLGDRELLDFAPCIKEVKETITSAGRKRSYKVSMSKKGRVIETAWIDRLYVRSWFELSDQCSDAALSDKERKMIEGYLQKQVYGLPVRRELYLDKSGWRHSGSGKIFYNKHAITKGVADAIRAEAPVKVIRTDDHRFNTDGVEIVLEGVHQVAEGVSWIVYMASYFDVLKGPFKKAGYPFECIINVYGKSGMGKTSLIKTLCSPSRVFSFSQPQRRDRILREIQGFEGHTVLVDDYHPAEQKYDGERQNALKDRLVRLVEENGNAPNILISSEGLGGHLSMQDREIQIFLRKTVDWGLLTALNRKQGLLEEIRTAFYVQIVKNEEAVVDEIRAFCLEADKKHISDIQTGFRSSRYLGYIRCADHLFQKYLYDAYALPCGAYDIEADIQMHLKRQDEHMKVIREWEQPGTCLIALRNMLSSTDILRDVRDGKEFAATADTIYVDGRKRVHLAPKALRLGMMRYLQTTDVPVKKIVRELAAADVLITYEKGNELTQKVNGKRCYVIDIDGLREYCKFFEIGGYDE